LSSETKHKRSSRKPNGDYFILDLGILEEIEGAVVCLKRCCSFRSLNVMTEMFFFFVFIFCTDTEGVLRKERTWEGSDTSCLGGLAVGTYFRELYWYLSCCYGEIGDWGGILETEVDPFLGCLLVRYS